MKFTIMGNLKNLPETIKLISFHSGPSGSRRDAMTLYKEWIDSDMVGQGGLTKGNNMALLQSQNLTR